LPGGELIDGIQKIAWNVADRQYLNSRRLRPWTNGSGALTSSCPPPFPAISGRSVFFILFIFIYFVNLSFSFFARYTDCLVRSF